MKTYTEYKEMYDNTFAQHRLEMVLNSGDYKGYYLQPPGGGRFNSVLIMFTPEGIVLAGDHAPCRTGLVSNIGYGLDWFSSEKSPDYLCQKFGLERGFVRDHALTYVEEELKTLREASIVNEEAVEEWTELKEKLEADDIDSHDFYTTLRDLNVDAFYEVALGYDPNTMAKLAAIQHRFAACMGDLAKEESKVVEPRNA